MNPLRPIARRAARSLPIALFAALVFVAGQANAVLPASLPLWVSVRPPTPYVEARVLSADVAETHTVASFAAPDNARRVLIAFSASCTDFYIRTGGTAAAPSGDVTDGSGSERNPTSLTFAQGAQFSIVSPASCKVSLAYYFGDF